VGELRNHATRRSGSRVFRTSLEARSEVEKKTALILCLVSLHWDELILCSIYSWLTLQFSSPFRDLII